MNLTKEDICNARDAYLFDKTTLYVELDDGKVYGLDKGSKQWFLKNNFYDYFDSELMLSYFSHMTKV